MTPSPRPFRGLALRSRAPLAFAVLGVAPLIAAACVPEIAEKDDDATTSVATSGTGGTGGAGGSGGAAAGSGGNGSTGTGGGDPSASSASASSSGSGGATCDGDIYGANGHCYKVYPTPVASWQAAEAVCEAWGGTLATMTSPDENAFVYGLAVKNALYAFWFGIDDVAVEGKFEWVTKEPLSYTNWKSGQPNNLGNEDCGLSYTAEYAGQWGDGDCAEGKEQSFICEKGDVKDCVVNPENGHCYKVYPTPVASWQAAQSACVAWGGHLVTMTTASENAFVYGLAKSSNLYAYWFGINDVAAEGTFVWVTNEPVVYTNWKPGQPNNLGNEDCGLSYTTEYAGQWGDGDCAEGKEQSYICEMDK